MEEIQTPSTSCGSCKKQKKRLQYKRMSEDKKRDLIFRVMYLNENVRTVCHELDFNFSTGRNLVQKYKKTGEYSTLEKPMAPTQSAEAFGNATTKDTERKVRKCPLGLIFLADDKIKLVTSKSYTHEEEETLAKLHTQLSRINVV